MAKDYVNGHHDPDQAHVARLFEEAAAVIAHPDPQSLKAQEEHRRQAATEPRPGTQFPQSELFSEVL